MENTPKNFVPSKHLNVIIKNILAKFQEPPLIIFPSDYGSRIQLDWENPDNTNFQGVFSNLSAFYVPGKSPHGFYDRIPL